MRLSIILLTLIASSFLPIPAYGEDRNAESRALVQRLVLERAAAVASVQRIADEREEQLFAELAAKERRWRAEQHKSRKAQSELAKVTAERQRLVDEIANRDRRFAAEIEEYRRQVASIADSPDPRKREALKRYAEGDRAGGFDALVAIQKAETKAVAAGWREIAALAKDRKDRGELGTAEVIQFYETAQNMDSDYSWGWIELRLLYQEAGRLPDARRAAEQALMHAQNDWDRAAAEMSFGDVLVTSGDLSGARARFEASLKIHERLATANPSSGEALRDLSVSLERLGDVLVSSSDLAGARARFEEVLKIYERLAAANPSRVDIQRDLSVSLEKLGNVLVTSGDLAGARVRFEESLEIRERLAAANPSSAEAQRDLSVSLNKLGEALVVSGDLARGRARFEESLRIAERLAAANPSSAEAQRDLSVSLEKLGGVLVSSGDWKEARTRYEASLKLRERLAESNPSSPEAQRDLSVSLNKLGNVLVASGDLAGGRARFEKSLEIAERLAKSNPSSAEAQRDLMLSHIMLGGLTGGERHLEEVLRIARDLQRQGRLTPADARRVEALRNLMAAAEKADKP